jgi:hypothetical protein
MVQAKQTPGEGQGWQQFQFILRAIPESLMLTKSPKANFSLVGTI